jgi:hypothetical protein
VKNGESIVHGNTGKKNKLHLHDQEVLTDFFEETKKFAGPRATGIVRDLVRDRVEVALRDDDTELLELPTCYTKRNMYQQYTIEQGWVFKLDSKGKVISKTPADEELEEPASWPTFLNFWKTHYPKLVVPRPSEDICNECFLYANRHKYSTTVATTAAEERNPNAAVATVNARAEQMEENEAMILKASNHVVMAQAQCKYFQDKKKEAFDTRDNKPSERVLTYVGDFAQNLSLPHFGEVVKSNLATLTTWFLKAATALVWLTALRIRFACVQ